MKRLYKFVHKAKTYQDFEKRVLSFLRWYQVPVTWTKKDLEIFYKETKITLGKRNKVC